MIVVPNQRYMITLLGKNTPRLNEFTNCEKSCLKSANRTEFFWLTWTQFSLWTELLEAGGKPSTRLPPDDSYSLSKKQKNKTKNSFHDGWWHAFTSEMLTSQKTSSAHLLALPRKLHSEQALSNTNYGCKWSNCIHGLRTTEPSISECILTNTNRFYKYFHPKKMHQAQRSVNVSNTKNANPIHLKNL